MLRYLPLLLAVVAIVAASSWDRMVNSDLEGLAEGWAAVIETQVPKEIGPWVGQDLPVGENEALVAGAVGKVSRVYTNADTGESVTLWLIVGPMQGVVRHTPPVCYPAQGFSQQESQNRYVFAAEGQEPAEFWTAWFEKQDGVNRSRQRVFWAWTERRDGEPIRWQAPGQPRYEFPGTPALFKMYFTTVEPLVDGQPDLSKNPSNSLAELLLPEINALLAKGLPEVLPERPTPETTDSETPDEAEAATDTAA